MRSATNKKWRRWSGLILACSVLVSACMAPPPVAIVDRPQPPSTRINHHVVSKGDTLHTIAWRYELDDQQLATLNGLQPPYTLQQGQRLRLSDRPIAVPAGPSGTARAVAVVSSPITVEPVTGRAASAEAPVGTTDTSAPPISDVAAPVAATSEPPVAVPSSPDLPPAPAPAPAVAGAWQWPAGGSVTREYDASRVFKGINIHSSKGAPVKAAGAGTVVYAGSGLRGYGQLIILKHDDTYLSAYAHNSAIRVAENDTVKQGQIIGEVGGDPSDPGRLYFEIREHGKPVDPEKLLPRQ